jgi:hypothetical protein
MNGYTGKNRSRFCHLITDFHSATEAKIARSDCWCVTVASMAACLLFECIRLLISD